MTGRWAALLGLIGCALAAAVAADEQLGTEPEVVQPTFVVGVENIDHYPHYTYESGQWQGLGRELLDAFADHAGYRFIYQPYPVKRLMQEHMAGGVDFRFPDNPLWSAEMRTEVDVYYSSPFLQVIEGTMVRPEQQGQGIERIDTLGTIIGFTAASYQDRIDRQQVQLEESSDSQNLVQKAIKGRIDGAYLSIDSAHHILEQVLQQPDALIFDTSLPFDRYEYLLSSTTQPEVIEAFNRFLVDEKALVDGLIERYHIHRVPDIHSVD